MIPFIGDDSVILDVEARPLFVVSSDGRSVCFNFDPADPDLPGLPLEHSDERVTAGHTVQLCNAIAELWLERRTKGGRR